jgi:hypothetical protein
MWSIGRTASICGVASSLFAVSSAYGHVPSRAYQHEASTLAHLIRRDARAGGPSATTLVRTHAVCCSLRVTDVYYSAMPVTPPKHAQPAPPPPQPESDAPVSVEFPTHGAYHLRLLETVRGRPLAITVKEFGTEPGYVLGTEPETHASALEYEFNLLWYRVRPGSPAYGGRPGWFASVWYSYIVIGHGRSDLSRFELRQAVQVAKSAALRRPVEGEPMRRM